jgi:hypothetical protein
MWIRKLDLKLRLKNYCLLSCRQHKINSWSSRYISVVIFELVIFTLSSENLSLLIFTLYFINWTKVGCRTPNKFIYFPNVFFCDCAYFVDLGVKLLHIQIDYCKSSLITVLKVLHKSCELFFMVFVKYLSYRKSIQIKVLDHDTGYFWLHTKFLYNELSWKKSINFELRFFFWSRI